MAATILHIDDEQFASGFAQELHSLGYRVIESDDRDVVMRLVENGGVDLVVGEIQLTRSDGLELMQEIRACDPKLPILVVTGAARTPELYSETLELGVTDFLTKPVLDSQLRRSILELTGGENDDPRESAWPETGDLDELPVAELLRRLHFGGGTGVCIVSCGRKRLGIQVRNGSIVAIGVFGGQERLEDFLLRVGRITQHQHEALLNQISLGIGTVSETLLGMGLVDDDGLAHAECSRGEERLAEVFAWSTGSYRFLPGKKLKAGSNIELEIAITGLLLRGALRDADSGRASKALERRGRLYVSCGAAPDPALAMELGAPELEILETLNGDRTVTEILATEEVEARILYGLWLAGIVEFHSCPILVLDEVVAEPAGSAVQKGDSTPPWKSEESAPEPLRARLSELHDRIHSQNDFAVLGVEETLEDDEVRSAHERLLESLPSPAEVAPFPQLVTRLEGINSRIETAYAHLADADSRRAYAALCREEENEREVKAAGERALQAEDWFRKGEQALEKEHYDKAVEAFGMATHHRPDEGDYLAHLGYAMYRANPDEDLIMREAMEQIAKGIKLSPEREMPYLFLARIFKQSGDLTSARKVYRQAIRINSDCPEALRQLRLIGQREKREKKPKGIMGLLRKR